MALRSVVVILLIAASIAVAISSIAGALNLATVSGAKCSETSCDGWGQSTKKATENEGGKAVGEHSSNPDPSDEDHDTPREGLGNFAEGLTGNKNPSDLGDAVDGDIP